MRHYHNECSRAAKKDKDSDNKTSANVVSEALDNALISSSESKIESRVLDSKTLFYATSSRELFKNYVLGNLGKLYIGDD